MELSSSSRLLLIGKRGLLARSNLRGCLGCLHHRRSYSQGPDLLAVDHIAEPSVRPSKRRGSRGQQQGSNKVVRQRYTIHIPPVQGEVLFGLHPVLLALQMGRRNIHRLFLKRELENSDHRIIAAILNQCQQREIPIKAVNKDVLSALAQTRSHQGVGLDADPFEGELYTGNTSTNKSSSGEDLHIPKIWLFLNSVKDPMNFGAILRSAYYFGVEKIFTTFKNSCRPSPVVSKASAGALELTKLYRVPNTEEFIQDFKIQGWNIVGTVGVSEEARELPIVPMSDVTMNKHTILLIGNEGDGLSEYVLHQCDQLVSVAPTRGPQCAIDSLNVSVATGVLLHSLMHARQRK